MAAIAGLVALKVKTHGDFLRHYFTHHLQPARRGGHESPSPSMAASPISTLNLEYVVPVALNSLLDPPRPKCERAKAWSN